MYVLLVMFVVFFIFGVIVWGGVVGVRPSSLGLIQLQANELLHTLPVLHLGGAVGRKLT